MGPQGVVSAAPLTPFGLEVTTEAGTDLNAIPLEEIRRWVAEHRVLVLRGFAPLAGEALPRYGSRLGEVLEWDFGAVNNLVARPDSKNYLFTNRAVPFHWDGAFVGRIPHIILFQCEVAPPPGAGGETLFTDTVRLLARVTPEERAAWADVRITYSTEKIVHYGGRFTSPLVGTHPVSGERVVRYAEPVADLNPVTLEIEGVPAEEQPAFLARMRALLYDPSLCLAHAWREGDIVLADNHATLHGRNAFTTADRRHIRRVNVL